MAQLRNADVQWLLRRLPRALRTYAETSPAAKLFVAGGFIRAVIVDPAADPEEEGHLG